MPRITWTCTLLVIVITCGSAGAQKSSSTSAAAGDAAPLYRQAVDRLGQVRDLNDRFAPDGDARQAESYLRDLAPVIALLRQAASMPQARWGWTDIEQRVEQYGPLRRLAAIAVLQARYDLATRHADQALTDFAAALAVSRHVGQDPIILSKLVEVACTALAVAALAGELPAMAPDVRTRVPAMLDGLPASATFAAVVMGEQQLMADQEKQQAAHGNATPAWAAAAKPFFDAVAAAADRAPSDFEKAVTEARVKVALNPAQVVASSLIKAHRSVAVMQVQLAMLRCGVAVLNEGEAAVARSKDPYGQGPFHYEKTPTGFRLSSQLERNNKPVVLVFGGGG